MDKKKLIDRLVEQTLASAGKGKAGCVPCFARSLCMVAVRQTAQPTSKNWPAER